jgi:hypothetical protein
LEIELEAFRLNPPGGRGRVEHFWAICEILWGTRNKNAKKKYFERNPWTDRMADAACREQYLGLSGCSSSGKSEFAAVWAIVNWLCAPKQTLVFCTSTSLKDSQRRIWGRIKKFWTEAAMPLPGKLVDSMYIIRTDDGSGVFSDENGICCIAGEKKNEKEAVGKLIGAHPERLILIVDEMPEITEAILTAALSNMAINPWFQMIGIGNFKSLYDCFGVFVRPKDGYDSISIEDEEWTTELGICLRFDGMRSPNILGGRDRYEGYNSKDLAAHKKNCGEDSAEFWRMCRSFHAPIGTVDVLYSEADLLAGHCASRIPSDGLSWLGPRVRWSSLDPSYTNGGDRSVQWFGWWGVLTNGIWTLCFDKYLLLRDEVSDKAPRDYQIVRKFRDNCHREGVQPENAAYDGTAASSFGAIISEEWSPKVLKVEFGGAPSDRPVAANDPRKANDLFDRRVSELWGVGREFMRAGQLKGMPPELCRELKARKYETSKRGGNVIIVIEEKKKMKLRIGFSPDIADSALVGLELVRKRHGALAGGISTGRRAAVSNFFRIAKEKDRVYSDLYAEADS